MRYQLLVSGSPDREQTPEEVYKTAELIGGAIAEVGQTLIIDEMHGVSYRAAKGARAGKSATFVVGFSPASSRYEHAETYRLPVDEFDFLQFTGGEYVGRDTLAVRSADAVVIVGGETGSLHQLAAALELGKICGVVTGSGGVADLAPHFVESLAPRQRERLISDSNPGRLIKKIITVLDKKTQSRA